MSTYSLADLCDLADVTARTVRFYIAQGLLRPPTGAGPAARYDDGHLYRLRVIRRLQREHLPLAEIRKRLAAVSDQEVERLAQEAPPVTDSAADYISRVLGSRGLPSPVARSVPAATMSPAAAPAPALALGVAEARAAVTPGASSGSGEADLGRSQWERVVLHPDIEIHVRRPLSRDQNRRVERLIDAARAILQEERP